MKRNGRLGVLKFQVGSNLYSNVNFARADAEWKAKRTKQDVPVYHNIDGNKGIVIFIVKHKPIDTIA